MKKPIISFAIAMAALGITATAAQAQNSGTTILKVKLTETLGITVNDAEVLLPFNTYADYQNGVAVVKSNHLTVTSSKPYTINVKTAAATLSGAIASNTSTLSAGDVAVELDNPTAQNLGGTVATVSSLSTTDAPILTGATAAAAKNINIKYSIPASISKTSEIIGKPADTYSTTVTYTITQ